MNRLKFYKEVLKLKKTNFDKLVMAENISRAVKEEGFVTQQLGKYTIVKNQGIGEKELFWLLENFSLPYDAQIIIIDCIKEIDEKTKSNFERSERRKEIGIRLLNNDLLTDALVQAKSIDFLESFYIDQIIFSRKLKPLSAKNLLKKVMERAKDARGEGKKEWTHISKGLYYLCRWNPKILTEEARLVPESPFNRSGICSLNSELNRMRICVNDLLEKIQIVALRADQMHLEEIEKAKNELVKSIDILK